MLIPSYIVNKLLKQNNTLISSYFWKLHVSLNPIIYCHATEEKVSDDRSEEKRESLTYINRGNHQSIAVSPLDMLEEELISFQKQQENLFACTTVLGGPQDSPELRGTIVELKQMLAVAESSISNRLKGEVSEYEIERHAVLEDGFFELKADYFALLRHCVNAEATPLPQVVVTPPSYNQGPDIQRFGNPHASPALQTMQPPPVHRGRLFY